MSHRLQVLVPESLDARIRKAADRKRVSKGAWVRSALEAALDRDVTTAGRRDPVARLSSLQAPTSDIEQMLREIDSGRS